MGKKQKLKQQEELERQYNQNEQEEATLLRKKKY